MPYFNFDLELTAGTTKASYEEIEMNVVAGILTEIEMEIPAGVMGLAYFAVFHQEAQIIPLTGSDWITGNNDRPKARPYYPIPAFDTKLIARGYNEDDSYSHTIKFRIEVLSRKEAYPFESLEDLTSDLHNELKSLNEGISRLEQSLTSFVDLWTKPQQNEESNNKPEE